MKRNARTPRRRRTGLGSAGYLGIFVGLASAGLLVASGGRASGPPPAGANPPAPAPPPPTFTPTERIDVEEAVSFPYDI